MKRLKPMVVTMMVAIFAFTSSHSVLEGLGFIHHHEVAHAEGADHSENNHEAADGVCRVESGHEDLQKPVADAHEISHSLVSFCVLLLSDDLDEYPSGRSSGLPPPELVTSWQFSYRAALPARAPSRIS